MKTFFGRMFLTFVFFCGACSENKQQEQANSNSKELKSEKVRKTDEAILNLGQKYIATIDWDKDFLRKDNTVQPFTINFETALLKDGRQPVLFVGSLSCSAPPKSAQV